MSHIDPNNIPENIRKCMEPKLRKEMKVLTLCEVFEKEDRKDELEMHRQLEAYCNCHDIGFVHSRTDKKSTTQKGTPDFVLLWGGYGCAIELKGPHGKLSPEQEKVIQAWTHKSRIPCLVTSSLKEAIEFAHTMLGYPKGTSG